MTVRRKLVRSLAEGLLRDHHIDEPPVPIEEIAAGMGLEVIRQYADESLSGFLLRDPDRRAAIVGVNARHHRHRRRFTIAHEIGHFLLHKGERLRIDRVDRMFLVSRRDDDSAKGTSVEEREANLFAAELLMPAEHLHRDLRRREGIDLFESRTRLDELAKKYSVSPQALTFRLAYLGYSPPLG